MVRSLSARKRALLSSRLLQADLAQALSRRTVTQNDHCVAILARRRHALKADDKSPHSVGGTECGDLSSGFSARPPRASSATQNHERDGSPRQLLSRSWCCRSARFDPRNSQPSRVVTQAAQTTAAAFGGSRSASPCSVAAASERGCGNIGKRSKPFVTLLCHLFTERATS